jgi:riboflavin kinase / FMN adenylyltransferase
MTRIDDIAIWTGDGDAPAGLHGAVVAIGNFDGVHLGHKALLALARGRASRLGAPLLALTFEPHPRSVFRPETPVFRLSDRLMRRTLLAREGVTGVVELTFDASLAAMSAESFIDDLLIGALGARGVAVGEDFRFGRNRAGDAEMLRARLGETVDTLGAVMSADGETVSSSRIRSHLEAGDIRAANALLGHSWRLRAEVRHGDKRGRELGYPTANMVLPADNQLRHGIYAVAVEIDGVWRPGAASFGRRPTFDDGAPRLETFVFDFNGDLYGQTLDVIFSDWIRGEEKFDSISALQQQMAADCDKARSIVHDLP